MRVRDLQRGRIKAFLAGKLETHSANSVRIMHATLRVILNAAVDDGLIVENPTDKLGRALKLVAKTRVPQEHVKAFDRAQRDTFLTTAAKIEPWWAPMWDVQALSGLRPGDVYALQEAGLDLDAGTARIVRTLADYGKSVDTPKGNRGRTIELSARAVQVLRTHITTRKAMKLTPGAMKLKPGWCENARAVLLLPGRDLPRPPEHPRRLRPGGEEGEASPRHPPRPPAHLCESAPSRRDGRLLREQDGRAREYPGNRRHVRPLAPRRTARARSTCSMPRRRPQLTPPTGRSRRSCEHRPRDSHTSLWPSSPGTAGHEPSPYAGCGAGNE